MHLNNFEHWRLIRGNFFQCYCDKKKGECYWQGQGKINIQAQIDQMRCETNKKEEVTDSEMSSLISRPARITPGLTCDNKDRIVGGTVVFHSHLSTQFNH